jgi:imidazolonepropionase-like amidohydrolase
LSGHSVLVADRVWDGVSPGPIQRGFVRIEDGTISAVGRAADLPGDATFEDLGDATILPGLINAHVHITFRASMTVLDDYLRERDAGFDTLYARAEENLRAAIACGTTTVRDLGTLNDVVFAARSAIREGKLDGPDIVAAGEGITSNGGHCHFFGIEAEGEDALRAAVRRQHDAGADCIKVFATGGNLTPGTDPFAPQYSQAELQAVVDEANVAGLPVASHAHSPDGIRRSTAVRVNTIEHCFFETPDGIDFDERCAEDMAEAGIAVVPTQGISLLAFFRDPALLDELPPDATPRRLVPKMERALRNFARMRELGVSIIAGTDAGIPRRHFGDFAADLACWSIDDGGIGMGPLEAMKGATSECARLLGLEDRGVLEPGRRADVLVVDGNPLDDIGDITRTRRVMVAGRRIVG